VLGTSETRQLLRDDLLDAEGMPRLGAAKLLAWAYRDAGEMAGWRKFVDERLAAATGNDAKALWSVVRAYTEAIRPKTPEPARSLEGLNAALVMAESERVRMVVLEEVVQFYREREARLAAVELVESVKGQFGAESAAALASLQESLRREDAARKAEAAKRQAAADRVRNASHLRYLRSCLAAARASGDAEAAASLEKAVRETEALLKP
jgi:hypothetical protein